MIMIKIFLSTILLSILFPLLTFGTVYEPNGYGDFKKSNLTSEDKSLNDIVSEYGYQAGLYWVWSSENLKTTILFKILSTDIICILTQEYADDVMPVSWITKYLSAQNFDYDNEYSAYQREKDLDDGIKQKILSLSFIEGTIHVKAENNTITDLKNGYIYTFENGYMVDYQSYDGLNKWAKEMKGTKIFEIVKENAIKHNSREVDILKEINIQFDYLSRISIDYLPLARSERYNYNYALLYIDLYKPQISLNEFMEIVHHKAEAIKVTPTQTILFYNSNSYYFDRNKILCNVI